MVRTSASGAGGRGFDPGPDHTKDFKNGTIVAALLGARINRMRQTFVNSENT